MNVGPTFLAAKHAHHGSVAGRMSASCLCIFCGHAHQAGLKPARFSFQTIFFFSACLFLKTHRLLSSFMNGCIAFYEGITSFPTIACKSYLGKKNDYFGCEVEDHHLRLLRRVRNIQCHPEAAVKVTSGLPSPDSSQDVDCWFSFQYS